MAFPSTQDGRPARGCHDRHGWMARGHCATSPSGEHGQIVADGKDGESVLARLGVSTSGIAKAVARAERP